MQIYNLEKEIIEILEEKYKHTIAKDDPLLLTITAQTKVTEHLLDIQKENFKTQFREFQNDLSNLLDSSKLDSDNNNKIILSNLKEMLKQLLESYKKELDKEFIKAGAEYKQAQIWYSNTKFWALISVCACVVSISFLFLKEIL
jgi:ElaB/YqjD/DUF883 family membrane-anchored ribosome-binding protein